MKRIVKYGKRIIEYTLICARNRKNILLQALPEDKIRVYAPTGTSLKSIDAYILEKIDWIDEAHSHMREALKKYTEKLPESILLEGKRVNLEIKSSDRNFVNFKNDSVVLETTYATEEEIIEQLKRALVELSLKRFRFYLDKWSPTFNKQYGRVTVREQKTRWGSCSSKNNLNFNWKLVLAPSQALEYVVIHELCHLLHFNHSALFWKEVVKRMPDYDIWKKWLKQHGRELSIG